MTAIDILAGYETYLRSLTDLESLEIKTALRRHPLYMDFSGQPTVQPWRERGEYVPFLFQIWNETKETLLPFFKQENRDVIKMTC